MADQPFLKTRIKQNINQVNQPIIKILIPKQTLEYVPKFMAIRELVINAKNYGVTLPNFPNKSVLGSIELMVRLKY